MYKFHQHNGYICGMWPGSPICFHLAANLRFDNFPLCNFVSFVGYIKRQFEQ